jgi:hypothetical protein
MFFNAIKAAPQNSSDASQLVVHYLAYDTTVSNSVYGQVIFKSSGKVLSSKELIQKILGTQQYSRISVNSEGSQIVAWGDGLTSFNL